ncbi:hypothetical protein HKX48_002232 [Thoreauomyces humboldtii]|nr:hypothetical protein HKX48_002232 [Thoreauomyces humboldtii]
MAKFKATSKKAVEEFRQLAQAQASETARRHGAEARVMALQAQLAEVTRAETQRARSEAQLERLSREVQFLQTQRDASQKEVTELESKRQALALELGELAENRVGRDEAVSATASEIDSRRANELSYDLAQIKERFRSDVTALQTQREGMSREVAELRREREALHDEMTNLREETRKLEVSRRHISEDLIQSAEQLDAAPRTAYPEMEELARTVSIGDALGSTGDAKRLPLPPPRAPSRLLGPREDARRASETSRRLTEPALDFSATFAGAGAGSPGGRRDKWTKDWKTNLKATKTKLKNAIPQKALGPQGLDGAPDGGGSGNSLLTYGGNMFKIGAKNKSVSKSDGDLTRAVPPIPPKNDDVRPTHSFQPHSYRSPRKCNLCNDKLWGRELRCEGCGYHCHNKCAPSVIGQCFASNGEPTSVLFTAPTDATHQTFGIPLDKLLEREGGTVPKIVIKCIAAVEYRGMSAEGIYRKSGPLTQINKILAAVERGEDVDLMTETHDVDITAITSLLKQFFRDLPDPLLTTTLYSAWTAVFRGSDDPGATMTQVVELLKLLPPNNLTTLAYLALHLDRIQQHSTENLMTPTNIGVVFGPSLLRPEEQETQLDLAESSAKNAVIEFLVRNARKLFAAGEETEGAPAVDGDEEGEEIEGDEEDSSGVDRTVEEDVEKEGQTVDGVAVDRISEPRLRPRMGSPTTRVSEKPPVVVFNGINLQQS